MQASSLISPGRLVSNLGTVQVIVLVLRDLLHGFNEAANLVCDCPEVAPVDYSLILGLKCGGVFQVLASREFVREV